MILCLGTTPAIQRVMIFNQLTITAVNRAVDVIEAPAGKAVNVAKVLKTLGHDPLATGFVGGPRGEFLRHQLDRADIAHDFVDVNPNTRQCVTLIDRAANTHTELVEESSAVAPTAFVLLTNKLQKLLANAKILTMSGTLVPGAPQDLYACCVRLASAANVPSIIDAHGAPLRAALAEKPTVVKPNRAELASTVSMPVDTDAHLRDAIRALIDLGAQNVVVTLGPDGALASDGRQFWRIRIPKVEVVNTIGSGDAFTAGLAAALAEGAPLPDAAALGAACGVANALTLLAGDVRSDDLARLRPQIRAELV